MHKLYMVGPLEGLWQDVPLCAERILRQSCLLVTQDVARVRDWLAQSDVDTPLLETSDRAAMATLEAALLAGDVAWLVMNLDELDGPACSLLGLLVERGVELNAIPGPSHVISALAVSGLPTDSFTYLGVLSECSIGRRALLDSVADEPHTLVCRVSAGLGIQALQDIVACLGDRRVALSGEQGMWRGQASQAQELPGRRQLVLIVEGAGQALAWTQERVEDEISRLLTTGASPRDAARDVARRSGWSKRQVYRIAVAPCREA